ncbi:MAG: MFS transporter, partial [Planctomycetota bacterium]|nr:MFS transporter [Planctomycetota bacterium]
MRADEQVVATPGRWLILLAMTGSLAMIMLDTTVVAVALPSIQKSLGVDQNMLEWVIVAYLVILASFMALGGRFGDVIGKPRAFVIGIIGFGVSSLLSGLAWNGEALIGFRIMQGFFAVIMQPSSSAIVINSFAPGERGKAMAVYAGIPLLFLTAGPVLGGFITQYGSWRYCFLLNVPVAAMVSVAAIILRIPDVRKPLIRFDWLGT